MGSQPALTPAYTIRPRSNFGGYALTSDAGRFPKSRKKMESSIVTITQLLEENAGEFGDRTFCICEDQAYGSKTIRDNAACVAANLAARGLSKDDKVVLLMGNCIEFLYVFLGLGRIAAVCVPVNPMLKPDEIAYIVNDSEAQMLITIPEFVPMLPTLRSLSPHLKKVLICGDPKNGQAPEGTEPFSVLLEPVDVIPEIAAKPETEAALIYTSGTTGLPKGVVLTHKNYVTNARMMIKAATLTEHDRFFCVLPLYHVNAQVVTVLAPMTAGADMVLMKKFNAFGILPMIVKYKPTIMSAVPAIYRVMCHMPKAGGYDLSSIRFFVSGAAPLPEEIYQAVQRVLEKPLIQGYGLSEATCASAVAYAEDPVKWDSVGPALAYTNIRIVNEEGVDMPVGQIGEILVAGPAVMKGYYKNPEATREVIKDGWLHTGDLGRFDEDGYLYIVGRVKDMIIRSGQNIYPQQIENVLGTLEGVAETCVVGVPESRRGQEVLAVIRCAEGCSLDENEIVEHCQSKLASYKCPKYVRFVDELPKTATGKIKKSEVADQFSDIAKDSSTEKG